MHRLVFAFIIAANFAAFGSAAADARPSVVLKLQGDVVHRDASGAVKLTPVEGEALKPGETVRYDIVATNAGGDPASKLVPVGKIPAGTAYEAGSASVSGASRVEFSIDGGKTWSAKPLVRVQTANGTIEKPADPASYTTLRWIGAPSLAAKASVTYSYQVRIK